MTEADINSGLRVEGAAMSASEIERTLCTAG